MKEIRNIINAYDLMDWSNERAALATVVSVEESAYRRIGARMFVKSSGNWIGGISGGCLEGDALKRAQKAIAKNEPSIVVYDTMEDDAHQIGVGLGCNGRIEVLFTPIIPEDKNNPIRRLKRIQNNRNPTIFYQLLSSFENKYESHNSFGEFAFSNEFASSVNIDHDELVNYTNLVLQKKKSKVFTILSKTGENLNLLVEFIRPELKLILIGDNYDVNAFVGIANEMGWEINVVGLIRKFDKIVSRIAKKTISYKEAESLEIDHYTAVVLMSHDYNWDKKMLQLFLKKDPPYLGMLGPKKRMHKIQTELRTDCPHLNLADAINFYSPIGLDIGAESPEEIALSVAAEIIATFRFRKGTSLKFREGSIHERDI